MKIRCLDLFPTLFKNTLHQGWLYCVTLVFREHTGVTENARELHEQLRKKMRPDAIRVNLLKWQRSYRFVQKIQWRGIRTEMGRSGSYADAP
jgi:hypothetical protein